MKTKPRAVVYQLAKTAFGPIGVVESADDGLLLAVRTCLRTMTETEIAIGLEFPDATKTKESDVLKLLLQYFEQPARANFSCVKFDWTGFSEFRKEITLACMTIPVGQTRSYGELAEMAGYGQKWARPAGGVMRNNRWSIVVPCHRVLGAGNSPGGYGGPSGLYYKRKLLALEGFELRLPKSPRIPGEKRSS